MIELVKNDEEVLNLTGMQERADLVKGLYRGLIAFAGKDTENLDAFQSVLDVSTDLINLAEEHRILQRRVKALSDAIEEFPGGTDVLRLLEMDACAENSQ